MSDSARASIISRGIRIRWRARRCGWRATSPAPFRLVVHQVDHGEPRRDLGARCALQAVVDLVLQQLGGLVEQVDRYQPVGEPADHLVAAAANRSQIAKVVEQAQRFDRRQLIALPARNRPSKVFAASALMWRVIYEVGNAVSAIAHDVEGVAVAVFLGVEPRQKLQRLGFGVVAAPGVVSISRSMMTSALLSLAERIAQHDLAQPALRRRRPHPKPRQSDRQ